MKDSVPAVYFGLAAAALASVAGQAFGQAGVAFAPAVERLVVGDRPYWIECGDIDADGDADLAVLLWDGTSWVSFLRNNGRGGFDLDSAMLPGVSTQGSAVPTLGDVDGDGDLDLVVWPSVSEPGLVLMLNDGAGVFSEGQTVPLGGVPTRVVVEDMDGNGFADLVVSSSAGGTVDIYSNTGGVYTGREVPIAVGTNPVPLIVADVNDDGRPDILSGSHVFSNGRLSVALNLGGGEFAPVAAYGSLRTITDMQCADLDGDGDTDVAVLDWEFSDFVSDFVSDSGQEHRAGAGSDGSRGISSARLATYFNNGDGSFGGLETYDLGFGVIGYSLAIADLDGDGDSDITVGGQEPPLESRGLWRFDNDGTGAFSLVDRLPASDYCRSVIAVDLDSDGDPDLAAANINLYASARAAPGDVSLLFNDGQGSIVREPRLASAVASPSASVSGDFDGDGDDDVAVAGFGGGVSVMLNEAGTGLTPTQLVSVGDVLEQIVGVDIDLDGDLDLIAADSAADSGRVLRNNGLGHFGVSAAVPLGDRPSCLAVSDVDLDGDPDLLAGNRGDGEVVLLLNDGAGVFTSGGIVGSGIAPAWVAAGDLNADGAPDLAIAYQVTDTVSLLFGNGDGTFGGEQVLEVGANPSGISIADFEGDGLAEVVVAGYGRENELASVLVFEQDGAGVFTERASLSAGVATWKLSTPDMNGDGLPDLVITSTRASIASVLLSDGAGGFGEEIRYSTGGLAGSIVALDLDQDGDTDLLATNPLDQDLALLSNTPAGPGCGPSDLAEPYGVLDLSDINAFVAAFVAGDPAADVSAPFGVFDLGDVTAFLQGFLAGCP